MSDTLEIRLSGQVAGAPVATRDIDFSEIKPLISQIEEATAIEAGIDRSTGARSQRSGGKRRTLNKVQLALESVFTRREPSATVATYQFVVGEELTDAVSKITAGLAGHAGNQLVPAAALAVRNALKRTIGTGLSVQLVNGVETPVFSAANPPPELDVYPTRKFQSEIVARLLRVGGKEPAARVKLLGSGQVVTLQLDGEKAARELGPHLYRDAVITGLGEWVIDPKRFSIPTRLLKFKVFSYRVLQPVDIDTAIEEMTQATGGIWDQVDPTDPERGDVPEGSSDLS